MCHQVMESSLDFGKPECCLCSVFIYRFIGTVADYFDCSELCREIVPFTVTPAYLQ